MKTPEISTIQLSQIFNNLNVRVGDILISFSYSKIFVYESPEFVYNNILKDCKTETNVCQMLSIFKLYILPEMYRYTFNLLVKNKDIQLVTFKEFGINTKEDKEDIKRNCTIIKTKSMQAFDIKHNIHQPETNTNDNILNIILDNLKQLADKGIYAELLLKNYKTKI